MTREEKQKAIDALKISVPMKALTQKEFNDYIQTLNKVMYWLEQEPNTKNDLGVDCISRQEVLRLLANSIGKTNTYLQTKVLKMSPVTPQEPKWIPVSEKLPEPFTFVNATCRSLVDDRENWVVETIYLPIPKEVNKHGYSDWGNIPMLNWGEAEVIAWVERIIPQPYKAESEG